MEPIEIPGIQLVEEIGHGAYSVVYRARRGDMLLAVKVHHQRREEGAVRRFRREAAALARLRCPGLVAILDVGEAEGRPYLIMEHIAGRTLAQVIEDGSLPEERLVGIARQLADTLAEVHRHGVVHRDIKPANIILTEDGGVRLIDFGLATRMASEAGTEEAVGTFVYSAPEQTGMLKRPVDGRTDLYALGVVLFECATGVPPFRGEDSGDLIRMHALMPAPRARATARAQAQAMGSAAAHGEPALISSALDAIIAKLLAKDPDDRYQSAAGLRADLDALERLNEALGRREPIQLDTLSTRPLPEDAVAFVGRETELATLRARLLETCRGHGSVALLEGEAGMGKSRLLSQLLHEAHRSGALVLRCATSRTPGPLGALRHAFDQYLHNLERGGSRQERSDSRFSAELRGRLLKAAGDRAPWVARLGPRVAAAIGVTAAPRVADEVPDLMLVVLVRFIEELATLFPAVVLAVDDAHRIDEGSRRVLTALAASAPQRQLLIVCTIAAEAGEAAADALASDLRCDPTSRLRLAVLGENEVRQLVASHLGADGSAGEVDAELVQQIVQRSGGNPYAVGELIRSMLDAGALHPAWGRWVADHERLADLELPADVAELVLQRTAQVSGPTRDLLTVAALIGAPLRAALLAAAAGGTVEASRAALDEAMQARLIEHTADGGYGFVHERLREVLCERLAPDTRRALHQRIARAIEETAPARTSTATVRGANSEAALRYALAYHYAHGETEKDPLRVAAANLAAGQAAIAQHVYADAYNFLTEAHRQVRAAGQTPDSKLLEPLAEACRRIGRWQEAVVHLREARHQETAPLVRARLSVCLADIHLTNMDTVRANEEVLYGLGDLGRYPSGSAFLRLLAVLWYLVADLIAQYRRPETAKEERERLRLRFALHRLAGSVAYYDMRQAAVAEHGVLTLYAAHRLGPSPELVYCYADFATLFGIYRWRGLAERYSARARRVALMLGDRTAQAYAEFFASVAIHASGDPLRGLRLAEVALEKYAPWFAGREFFNCCVEPGWNLFLRGYAREAWVWIERGMARASLGDATMRRDHINITYAVSTLALLGRFEEAQRLASDALALLDEASKRLDWAAFLGSQMMLLIAQGELGAPLDEAIAHYRRLELRPEQLPFHMRHACIFLPYARLAQAIREPQPERLRELRRSLRDLGRLGAHPVLLAHRLVIEGALLRLEEKPERAVEKFAAAEAVAWKIDNPWCLFEVARQRAHLLVAAGQVTMATHYARIAHGLAAEHGWRPLVRLIDKEFQRLLAHRRRSSYGAVPTSGDAGSIKLSRHLAALREVSLASAAVFDPDEQARLALDAIVRILGAERAFLFLCDEEGRLVYRAGRDYSRSDLAEVSSYSRTVVEQVRVTLAPVAVSGGDEGLMLGAESVLVNDLRSILAAPLVLRDRLVGVVYLDNRTTRGLFTLDDAEILRAIANHIAIAFETARAARLEVQRSQLSAQLEVEKQQRRLAETLRDLVGALGAAQDVPQVLQHLVDSLAQMVPCDRSCSLLWENGRLTVMSVYGDDVSAYAREDDPLLEAVLRSSSPILVEDAARDRRCTVPGARGSILGMPIRYRDSTVGAILIESNAAGAYGEHQATIAAAFTGQAGVAVAKARMFSEVQRLATTDALTGALNRRHFTMLAEQEILRARQKRRGLAVVMFDADHFKRVNDTYGHGAGDQVLREISDRCRAATRGDDLFGRYGGEEFIMLLPGADQEAAVEIADRIRQAIASRPVSTEQGELSVTISAGIACLDEATETLAKIVERADAALYEAKRAGRNRVMTG
ncbi:MAG TPA: diguanylate cyclase [Polyangia bacterium]|nr:diguanylate cyclase [Polyangia bacterium]